MPIHFQRTDEQNKNGPVLENQLVFPHFHQKTQIQECQKQDLNEYHGGSDSRNYRR